MLLLAACVCLSLSSCNKDEAEPEPTLDKTSITLYVDETSQLKYSGKECIWSSENSLIASVKDGLVKGEHVGSTIIRANNLTCQVTVKPKYTGVYEPYIVWGASQSSVKSYMTGYTLKESSSTKLTYNGKGFVNAYQYTFENGKLKGSSILLPLSYSTTFLEFLAERYLIGGHADNIYSFYTLDSSTIILFTLESYGMVVVYTANNSSNTKEVKDIFSSDF